jgi:hypothetical protein
MIDFVTTSKTLASLVGAGTIGGLASGELSRRLAAREARKKHLRGLLCDLLELRHDLIGMREIPKAFEIFPQYKDMLVVALPAILEMVAKPAKLHEHYESAIVELAALDPLLAFKLRSKNLAIAILGMLSKLAQQNPVGIPIAAQVFNILGDAGTSALDESIIRVSKELGWRIKRDTQAVLDRKPEMPELMNRLLPLVQQIIDSEARAGNVPLEDTKASSAKASL